MKPASHECHDGMEIDLRKLLGACLKKWWLILLCGLLAAGVAWVYTANYVTPMYRAGVTIYVNSSKSGNVESISGSSLTASKQLVGTYISIIRSDAVLEKVAERPELDCSADYIRKAMSAQQVSETELFQVMISDADPEQAALIANALAEVAPGEIENIVEGSSTKIVDYAKVPDSAYTPSYMRNIQLGAVIGCFLAVAFIFLQYLLDTRIKDKNDLEQLYNLPVLGSIPVFTQQSGKKKKAVYPYEDNLPER
jgi:capsular polysaccharide biosynthesis protein